jgi:hypothetical protein
MAKETERERERERERALLGTTSITNNRKETYDIEKETCHMAKEIEMPHGKRDLHIPGTWRGGSWAAGP